MSQRVFHSLTQGQQIALRESFEWISKGRSDPGFIIEGYAGTGKTYTTSILLDKISRETRLRSSQIVLCAPTNKAVKVQSQLETGLACKTIYSLLGLKMEQKEDKLVLGRAMERPTDSKYKLVILDECGMINAELRGYIEQSMARGVRYLFLGDREQLNPIGEEISTIWDSYPTVLMDEVVRHDNQILTLATRIRQSGKSVYDLEFRSDNDGHEGVWFIPGARFEQRVRRYAHLQKFTKEGVITKAVAWRNRTVDAMNNWIREEIFGDEVQRSRYLPGDRLVLTGPYEIEQANGLKLSLSTDDEVVVRMVDVGAHQFYSDLLVYHLTVDTEDGRRIIIDTVHERSEFEMDRKLADFANKARNGDKQQWKSFWGLKNSLAGLKYAFALTSHRAQGSSYRNVFVDADDILRNSNADECRRSLYVASSRATTKAFLS